MGFLNVVCIILMVIAALALIISVLLQSSDDSGLGALAGSTSSESFFSKNKLNTMEGKLAMITKGSAIAFVVLALLMLIIPG